MSGAADRGLRSRNVVRREAAESRLWHLWVRLEQQVSERLASKFGDWGL
jgi:hypothetical protein